MKTYTAYIDKNRFQKHTDIIFKLGTKHVRSFQYIGNVVDAYYTGNHNDPINWVEDIDVKKVSRKTPSIKYQADRIVLYDAMRVIETYWRNEINK